MEISWRVPRYKESYFKQPICSNACLHSSTNLNFQLILAPTKSHMAFYLLCTNAVDLLQDRHVTVSWRLSLRTQGGEKAIKGDSVVTAKPGCHSTFESQLCREFVSLDYFTTHVDEFLVNGVLEARAEFSLALTKAEVSDPSQGGAASSVTAAEPPRAESDTVSFFPKDSTVAVCAGRSGFWLALTLEEVNFQNAPASKTVHVRWYEKNRQSGQYYLTEGRDHIDLRSIHPIKLDVDTNGKTLTIKDSPAYELLKSTSNKKSQH